MIITGTDAGIVGKIEATSFALRSLLAHKPEDLSLPVYFQAESGGVPQLSTHHVFGRESASKK